MAKITRATQKLFGSTGGPSDIAVFGSLAAASPAFSTNAETIQSLSNFLDGWFSAVIGSNSPTVEDMNALFYLAFYQIAYAFQSGVAEWDAETTYYIGSLANAGNGDLYASLVDANLNQALSSTTKWRKIAGQNTVVTETTNYQMLAGDKLVLGNTIAGGIQVHLPDATINVGASYEVKKIDSSGNAVTVLTLLAQTIDGASSYTLDEQYGFLVVRSDGTNYHIIGAG